MKKLNDPFFLSAVMAACFALAFIDGLMNDAQGWSDMSFLGKTFIVLFVVILAYLFVTRWIGWLWHQVKKLVVVIYQVVTKKK